MADRAAPEAPHLAVLDGLRGAAVLVVLAFHLGFSVGWHPQHRLPRDVYSSLGALGVEMFFVLSAFLLFLPTLQRGTFGDRRSYGARRAARIVPAYLVCLAVVLALRPLLLPLELVPSPGIGSVLAHLTFTQLEFLPKREVGFSANGAVWTLSVEAFFYLTLPFVAVAFSRRPVVGLGLAAAVSLGWALLTPSSARAQVPAFAVCFGGGMFAAWVFVRSGQLRALRPAVVAALMACALGALVVCCLLGQGANPGKIFGGPAWTVLAMPLLLAAVCLLATCLTAPGQWLLTNRPILWVGRLSYSLYLYQLLAMHFALQTLHVRAVGSPRDVLVMTAFAVPATVLAAIASYTLVERPAQRWVRRRAVRSGPSSQVALPLRSEHVK